MNTSPSIWKSIWRGIISAICFVFSTWAVSNDPIASMTIGGILVAMAHQLEKRFLMV